MHRYRSKDQYTLNPAVLTCTFARIILFFLLYILLSQEIMRKNLSEGIFGPRKFSYVLLNKIKILALKNYIFVHGLPYMLSLNLHS